MADTDTLILKTLESIETLLEGASVLSKQKPLNSGQKQSQKQKSDKEVTKAFKAVAETTKGTNEALMGLNKSLIGLSSEIGRTTTGFGTLNTQLERFTDSLKPVEEREPAGMSVHEDLKFKELRTEIMFTTSEFKALGASMSMFRTKLDTVDTNGLASGLSHAVTPLASFVGAVSAQKVNPSANQQAAQIAGNFGGLGKSAKDATKAINEWNVPMNLWMKKLVENFSKGTSTFGGVTAILDSLGKVTQRLTGDFLNLAQVGMGSVTNLGTLYKYAFESGMSLKEYSKVIEDNITIASRAGSLDNFDALITAANSQLSAMGIFGKEAVQLQATLANSNTLMGVSQDQLRGSIQNQISVFDELRKSTNMTADEFGALIKSMSKNEQVQKELVGLAPQQRIARQQELLQIQTTGQRLGLAADESQKLADALMKQRGDTVKSRFEQAGRIQQLAAFAGMGDQGNRAAELTRKGRSRTSDETEELRKILGAIDDQTQGIYDSGSFGAQNVVDQLEPTLGSLGDIMKANRPGQLADKAGKVDQEAFGKHVDKFGQFVGEMTKYLRGFNESILPTILEGLGGALMLMFRGPITKVLMKAVGMGGGGVAAAEGAAAAEAGGLTTLLTKPIDAIKGAFSTLASPITNTAKWVSDLGATFTSTRAAFGTSVAVIEGAVTGISGIFSAGGFLAKGLLRFLGTMTPIAAAIDGVMEAFTGKLAKAMDPEGGIWSRIGGVAVAAISALPQMIIDGFTFIFGENFMKPIQSVFDVIKTGVMGAINGLSRVLLGGVSYLTDLLPKDSALRKMIDGAKDSLDKSIDANADTINKLGGLFGGENRKTLSELGDANTKAAADTDKKSKAAVATVQAAQSKFNDVQYGTDYSRMSAINDAQAILGSPQVQNRNAIAPATVNTPETPPAAKTDAKTAAAAQVTGGSDMMGVLNAILQVLRDSLTEEQKQALLAEQLLSRSRPGATFIPSEVIANRLIKQQGYA